MIRRPPRSTLDRSSAASDVYKRQDIGYTFWSTDRVLHEDVKARLSASLEADRKDRELETGRRMRTDEAIALSIQVAETCAGAQ